MIIVTGGAGFIGSNLVKSLNERGNNDIIVIDNLSDGTKFQNIVDCNIADYLDKQDFLQQIETNKALGNIEAVFHQGACSVTTEWDGRYMMDNNYQYSKALFHWCIERRIPFIYASSAAVYGGGQIFREERKYEQPLNVYGYSKWQFDQYVRRILPSAQSQIVGFRYFNVYGPREAHKKTMASVAFHFHQQLLEGNSVRLFKGTEGVANGEQRRDFVYVGDVCAVNLWFLDHPEASGIFNVGTGRSQTYNDMANAVINWHEQGHIEYITFPEHLRGRYQSFTQADISKLRAIGYCAEFKTVEQGVKEYLDWLSC